MASSSSSTPALQPLSEGRSYHAFLNHRGPDAKMTFAVHLQRALLSRGLTAFLDKDSMQVTENISRQIEDAIQTSSVHVAIFSERYAESSWCLNELHLMVQTGAPIIPVFYHVNPAELQSEDGKYSQALRSLEMKKSSEGKPRYDSAIIQKWREALASVASVADKSRLDLEAVDGDEGELVDKVVEQVQLQLEEIPLDVARFPTGLAEKVNDFETTVLPPEHSGILGIYGIGGVGKTTLATELFNRYKSRYSHSCFLPNIAETRLHQSLQTQFIPSLQMQLLKGLFHLDLLINSSHHGREKIRKRFLTTKVFVVLDDVDDMDILDALLPDKANLCSGSLVLITSRDKDVLASSGLEESSIYKLDGLNRKHSRELFCHHAFRLPGPCPEYEDLVDQFLTACQGSPLFLKVFGALLYRKKLPYWQSQLDSLHRTLPHQIKERLMISYNALTKDEQNLFLDIACIYAGQGRDATLRRLGQSYPHGSVLFQNLHNKCLVNVGFRNSIQMHAHFQELGKDIQKEASGEDRLQRRRWTEDIELSVTAKLQGIEIYLQHDDNACSEITWYRCVLKIYDAQDGLVERILGIVQNSPNLASLVWWLYPYSSLASWIPVKNLRLLSVGGMGLKTLWKDKLQAPLQLRHLDINAPLENIPNSIGELKNLEVIRILFSANPSKDISFDTIECPEHSNNNWWPVPLLRLPEEFCHLRSLKKLVLRCCTQMKSLPDSFGDLSNLEYLRLHLCESLERLPISFGRLIRLKYLYLGDCPSLTISAETLGDIRLLLALGISRCSKIEVLPPQVSQQRRLKHLELLGTNLKLLPNSIGQLSNLKFIILESPLETLPECFGDLRNLVMILFKNCNELKFLPESAGCLTQLTQLELISCHSLQLLPDSIGFLTQLTTLTVSDCHSLQFLPDSIRFLTQLTTLSVLDCHSLQFLPDSIGFLTQLSTLIVRDCHSLQILPDSIRFLTQLKVLAVTNCPCRSLPFERVVRDTEETGPFPHHGSFPNLLFLSIKQCNGVVEIGTLPNSLEVLELIACNKLRKIDQCLCSLHKLRVMSIVKCNELEDLPSMETLVSLEMLTALECLKLKSIRGIAQLTKLALKSLDVSDCVELEELPGVEHSDSLAPLYLPAWPEQQWDGGLQWRGGEVVHVHPLLPEEGRQVTFWRKTA